MPRMCHGNVIYDGLVHTLISKWRERRKTRRVKKSQK